MPPGLPHPGPRYEALVQLLHTADTLWNASRAFFARWKLGPSAFNVLYILHGEPQGLTQVALSRRLLVDRSNLTGLVDRLEQRGLVRRRAAPGDRRAHRVVLSAAGRRLMREILPVYYRVADEVFGRLSPARTRQLMDELGAVCARTEQAAAGLSAPRARKGRRQA